MGDELNLTTKKQKTKHKPTEVILKDGGMGEARASVRDELNVTTKKLQKWS